MAEKIQTGEQLQKSVQETLDLVRKASGTALKKAVDKTSRETVKETKKNSPKRTGVYAKSWGSRKIRGTDENNDGIWEYRPGDKGITFENGHQYFIIFYDQNNTKQRVQTTYDLINREKRRQHIIYQDHYDPE